MSAEERKNTLPMLGDADTVFADGNTMAAYAEANGNIRRNNIEYADNAARNAAQKALHDRMVNEGKILDLTVKMSRSIFQTFVPCRKRNGK